MAPPALPRRGRRTDWLAGFVVGVTAGFATLEIPTVGWLLVVAFGLVAAFGQGRLRSLGGLLTGLGAIWLVLLGRVALTCQAPDGAVGCQAPGIESWLAAGAGMLVAGIAVTVFAARLGR